jgi:hypothetical protein
LSVTFDAFIGGNEAIVLMTGLPMDRAPVLIDRASGASAACSPVELGGIPGMCMSFGMTTWPGKRPGRRDNAWCATVPLAAEATEVGLSLVLGDVVRNVTVHRRPPPEPVAVPELAPKPKRARRTRKASS